MARYLKSSLYIHLLPRIIIHLPPFINHLKITQSYSQTKIKPFYCTKSVIAPVKGLRQVRAMQECTSFISQVKERKNNNKNVRKTYYWKFIFVICIYSTYACRNLGTKSTQGTFAREHVSTQRTWTRKVRNLADSRTGWVDAMKWFLCRLAEHRIKLTIPNLFLLLKMFIELIFQIRCFSLILLFRVC